MGAIEEYAAKCVVKVVKSDNDARTILCGEEVQVDKDGKQFFIIPAHQASYIKNTCPGWTVTDEFVFEDEKKK